MLPFHIVTPSIAGAKTVIVLGAFRGGTSMIAGAVDALGISMIARSKAENPEYDNWEDKEIQDILHHGAYPVQLLNCGYFPRAVSQSQVQSGEYRQAAEIVADFQRKAESKLTEFRGFVSERNQAGSWGWKYPGTALWLLKTKLLQEVRNPHIITIFRDPVAIWQRETSVGLKTQNFQQEKASFRYATVQTEMLVECATTLKCPQLVVSYERATRDDLSKKSLAEGMRSFLQLPENPDLMGRAIHSMTRPNS